MKKVTGLGRGLSALIDDSARIKAETATNVAGGVRTIDVARIRPNPAQPRQIFDEEALAEMARGDATLVAGGMSHALRRERTGQPFAKRLVSIMRIPELKAFSITGRGILRAGGDTRFSLFLDGIIIWIVGVPMAYLGAFVLHLPVYYVYLFAMSEEATKWVLGISRYRSLMMFLAIDRYGSPNAHGSRRSDVLIA